MYFYMIYLFHFFAYVYFISIVIYTFVHLILYRNYM